MDGSNASGRCHLLELPPELRLIIYEYAFGTPYCPLMILQDLHRVRVRRKICRSPDTKNVIYGPPHNTTALLRTCRQIEREASPVVLDAAIFPVAVLSRDRNMPLGPFGRFLIWAVFFVFSGIFAIFYVASVHVMFLGYENAGMAWCKCFSITALSALLLERTRPWPRSWLQTIWEFDEPPNKVLPGGAMGLNSILRSARRVHLSIEICRIDDVEDVAQWMPDLVAMFNGNTRGLLQLTIEIGSYEQAARRGDVLVNAFGAIACKSRLQVMAPTTWWPHPPTEAWIEMLKRLGAEEVTNSWTWPTWGYLYWP